MYNYLIIFLVYSLAELANIIKYLFDYIKLNNKIICKACDTKYINNFMEDCTMYDYNDIKNEFEGLFYNKVKLKNIDKTTLNRTICELVNGGMYNEKIINEYINPNVKKIECKHDIKFKRKSKTNNINQISFNKNELKSLYSPLIVCFIKLYFRHYANYKLEKIGLVKHHLDKGYTIWTNNYNPSKGTPIVFYHGSIGGLIFYTHIIDILSEKYNLILPEVPALCWGNYTHDLPHVHEMVDMLIEFTDKHYDNIMFNVVGHSLGCNFASCTINRHSDRVKNLVIIEGGVFYPNTMKNYHNFNKDLKDFGENQIIDLLSIPLFYKDLYVQYYFMRSMTIENILYGKSEFELRDSREIYFVYSENDNKIDYKSQIKYIKSKNIDSSYCIFENRCHGSFNTDRTMQKYVIDIFDKITK
jgi:hypothetical protein